MKMIESLTTEFDREVQVTRKHLERLPDDKLAWRPHEKSYTASALASHIVECIVWGNSIFNQDEFDIDPTVYKPYQATSVADLLKTFDEKVANCKQALADVDDDEALMKLWRFNVMGRLWFEKEGVRKFV